MSNQGDIPAFGEEWDPEEELSPEERFRLSQKLDGMVDNLMTAAIIDLRPLVLAAAAAMDLDCDQADRVRDFLSAAWVAGARSGHSETLAQVLEAGAPIELVTPRSWELDSDPDADAESEPGPESE